MFIRTALQFIIPILIQAQPVGLKERISVQPVLKSEEVHGCGTYFRFDRMSENQVFALHWETEKAIVRVAGELHTLDLIQSKETHKIKKQRSVGSRFQETWSDGTISMILNYKIVSEDEAEQLEGEMILAAFGQKRSFKITGQSGCHLN